MNKANETFMWNDLLEYISCDDVLLKFNAQIPNTFGVLCNTLAYVNSRWDIYIF